MNAIIDLGSEWLIDTSMIRDPYIRLAIAAVGHDWVQGSPWVVVNKQLASIASVPITENLPRQPAEQN
jgi:hypothetical protein